ncbi:uncharacterized protein [Antedon mediterranea]|uniref:uncharacterized protein n=1 Tax=Antedon mediterranea TaxID=105859 RepID=UPI003AF62496
MTRFFTCFVVLCLVVCSAAQDKCCLKENMFAITSGSLLGLHADMEFSASSQEIFSVVDYTTSRFMYNSTAYTSDNNVSYTMVIDDFEQKVEWNIDFNTKKCQKVPFPEGKQMPVRCVPDNANFVKQVTYSGGTLVNMWYYPIKSPIQDGQVVITLTDKGCLPAGTSYVGKITNSGQEVDIMDTMGYYDFTPLTDVSKYFKLPSFCGSYETKPIDGARRFLKHRYFI